MLHFMLSRDLYLSRQGVDFQKLLRMQDFGTMFTSGKVAQLLYFRCGLLVSFRCSWGPRTIHELLLLLTRAQRRLSDGVILLNPSITMGSRGATLQLVLKRARYYQVLFQRLASSLPISKSLHRIQTPAGSTAAW